MMQIWVDADACPKPIKEVLFRVAQRLSINVTLVANQALRVPPSPYIRTFQVGAGFDVADHRIVAQAAPGDLVITADIPLAAEVLEKACFALNPRGEWYSPDSIRERLSMRDFLDTLRGSGIETGGPNSFTAGDTQAFAAKLDQFLAQQLATGGHRPPT